MRKEQRWRKRNRWKARKCELHGGQEGTGQMAAGGAERDQEVAKGLSLEEGKNEGERK